MVEKGNFMMKSIKKQWEKYWTPTPVNMRKWGEGILSGSVFLTSSAIIMHYPWIALIAVLLGFVGHCITNLFSE